MVADIVLPDGRVLNKELVRSGNAWWFQQYDRNDADLQALEADAILLFKALKDDLANPASV